MWSLVLKAQKSIEQLHKPKGMNESFRQDPNFQNLVQLGMDMFQHIIVYMQSDLVSDQDSQFTLMINAIFQYFNRKMQWESPYFCEYIFVLMVYNGGKQRLEGQFDNVYEQLQAIAEGAQPMDTNMLALLVDNLFKVLMNNLAVNKKHGEGLASNRFEACSTQGIQTQMNLLKVLCEMVGLIEVPEDEEPDNKLVTNSRIYLQIIVDLVKFLAAQDSQNRDLNLQLFEQVGILFEVYLVKTDKQVEVLYQAMELMFSEIQMNNKYLLSARKSHRHTLQSEIYCLVSLLQICHYFLNEIL